jgi:FkbM family methyltransferase
MKNWLEPLFEKASEQMNTNKGLFNDFSHIFVYGAGTFAQDIHRTLLNNGLPVSGFIDHLEQDASFLFGVPIYTPKQAAEMKGTDKALVILGLHNYQADVSMIIDRLKRTGFVRILSPIDLYDFFGTELGNRYWLTTRDYYFSLNSVLEEMHTLLADKASKFLFRSVMEYRLSGDVTTLPVPDTVNPYHPIDLPAWKTPLRFVDCGAFDGDTLKDFIKNNIPIQGVAAFEPDLTNYAKLSLYASTHKKELPEENLFPCGVYSSTKQISFESGKGMASNISSKGTTVIQCVSLDDAIPTFAPNLIKMDIEGAEYDALLGARQLITAHTPGIAASLYHRPEHLWQLPKLVENIAPGKYNFHMRSHAMNDFELVMYALPADQQ